MSGSRSRRWRRSSTRRDVGACDDKRVSVAAARPPRRGRETVRDMVWSLAAVGVFVVFILGVTYRAKPDAVQVVDPTTAVVSARAAAPFVVRVPVALNSQWRPTSARYEPPSFSSVPEATVFHLGYVTPQEQYAAVEQTDATAARAVRTLFEGGTDSGAGTGAFAGWERWQADSGRRQAYVRELGDSALIVQGSASDAELAELADSLRPRMAEAG